MTSGLKIDHEARREVLGHVRKQLPMIQSGIAAAQADLERLLKLERELTEAEGLEEASIGVE